MQWNAQTLNPVALQTYVDAIHHMGQHCVGFMDGIVRPSSRPGTNQSVLYNGHKRVHSLKFHAIAVPNGLVAHPYGPVVMR